MGLFRKRREPQSSLVPYMDPVEFSQLLATLETLAPARILEWGSGGSTIAILDRCPFVERLISIEHDRAWHDRVRGQIEDPRLELHLVEPDDAPPAELAAYKAWAARAEHDETVMRSYVGLPATLGLEFDFVLVDGRARCPCIRAGWALLRPGGCLILHDAQRETYHAAVHGLGARPVFLEPFSNGQICLVRKPTASRPHRS